MKMLSNPKISIITATWNSANTLIDCFSSIREQSYRNIEHIVIDGGSTDGTLNIVNDYIRDVSVFITGKDDGIYDALNKGVALATGDVIGFLHSDDVYASSQVLQRISLAFKDDSVCAVYGDLIYVQKNNINRIVRRWNGRPFDANLLSRGWMPAHPTLYVRRDWYLKIGGFNPSYRISADYLSVLQLFSAQDFKSIYIPQVFIKMRLGGVSNNSIISIVNKSGEDWRALRACKFTFFGALYAILYKNFSKLAQFT
jgi:glycosyltransferase involved in cell wall biosynthesis